MFGFFKKKERLPDFNYAAKGYLQVIIAKKYSPDLDLNMLERGYAAELLSEGCNIEQALSARWGGVRAIHANPTEFDDALATFKQVRIENGMPEVFETKEEAERAYLASAVAIVTLSHELDKLDYGRFLTFINAV